MGRQVARCWRILTASLDPTTLFCLNYVGVFMPLPAFLPLMFIASITGDLHVVVRDCETGARIQARCVTQTVEAPQLKEISQASQHLRHLQALSLECSAPGFRALRTAIEPQGLDSLKITLWLDRLERAVPRAELRELLNEGWGIFHGYLYGEDGEPLMGALVELPGVSAPSDQHGYFFLVYQPATAADGLPRAELLLIRDPAGSLLRQKPVFLLQEATHVIEDLAEPLAQPDHAFLSTHVPERIDSREMKHQTLRADPPDTIRVGLSCSCWNCSSVAVMSLETYVKRGLNDEWIASWRPDSLRAGAIAYRSYGASYVGSGGTFDICSTTCCQVNDSDTSLSTDDAVEATSGILLERNGFLFRSEYSAQNNSWDDPLDGLSCTNGDLSCGDGYVGSPAANWPCLEDATALGKGCFGHGRGMSQWGSQFWARDEGKEWVWITNHYYNAHGAGSGLRNSQLAFPFVYGAPVSPPLIGQGQTLVLGMEVFNQAEHTHHLLLGASLYSSATGYVDDPAHDLVLQVDPGTHLQQRIFAIPADLPPGNYDVLLGWYIDLNGDGQIQSSDHPIHLGRSNGALSVEPRISLAPYLNRWLSDPLCAAGAARIVDFILLVNGTCVPAG